MQALPTATLEAYLQASIREYVAQGYRVLAQTSTTAQLVKKKKFSFWVCVLLAGIFYLPYYWAKKDQIVWLTVDSLGNLSKTLGKG